MLSQAVAAAVRSAPEGVRSLMSFPAEWGVQMAVASHVNVALVSEDACVYVHVVYAC